jgi:hypothetical protein
METQSVEFGRTVDCTVAAALVAAGDIAPGCRRMESVDTDAGSPTVRRSECLICMALRFECS